LPQHCLARSRQFPRFLLHNRRSDLVLFDRLQNERCQGREGLGPAGNGCLR
jgi:hypothetical protein